MNNSDYLWFVIVPKVECSEFFELEIHEKNKINLEMDQLSKLIRHEYQYDKVNIGMIGNIVSQLHIHVVGRRKGDAVWPGVVWGAAVNKRYNLNEFEAIKDSLTFEL
jgi:diadenosine tetraphosphate (Ap4A) HIT family hydrolase